MRFLGVSTHHRPLIARLATQPEYGLFHVRYNAVHPGAEQDVFPYLDAADPRPGIVAFTATCWGQLLRHRRIPERERTPSATDCYRFVLSNPAVDICMTGTANQEQTDQALAALEQGPLSDDEMAWMRRVGRAIYAKK